MITKIRIKNFKNLQDTGPLNLKPLTFLVGPNSSGKTSLLQTLLLLKQTCESNDPRISLLPNDGYVQLGTYPEYVYNNNSKSNLEIEFNFVSKLGFVFYRNKKDKENIKKVKCHITYCFNKKNSQVKIVSVKITEDNITITLLPKKKERYAISVTSEGKTKKFFGDLSKFYQIIPISQKRHTIDSKMISIMLEISFLIEQEFRQIKYVGPIRDYPRRTYITSGQKPEDVGTKGEKAIDVLSFSRNSGRAELKLMEKNVKLWMNNLGMASSIKLKEITPGYYQLIITDPITKIKSNLSDIGFGASQMLPIVIEGFYSNPGSLLLIEQPEIHLHPKAQATLADLFLTFKDEGKTLVIETHSEHILARLRRRIAEGKINAGEVAIYYFTPSTLGPRITEVTIDENGQYKEFPKGFFEEDFQEALEHTKLLLSKVNRK